MHHIFTYIERKIFRDVFITCFKVKNYFAVRGKTESIYEHKAITFSLKENIVRNYEENKENQREPFKFMALKWTRRTTDKAEVTRATNYLILPCKKCS